MPQQFVDAIAVAAEVERVRSLSGNALRRRWQSVVGRTVPKHLTSELMRRMIATRIQEEAFGTLDRAHSNFSMGSDDEIVPARPSAISRSERCWSAIIKAGATPSRSSREAMSGRGQPIPACRRSRGRSPGQPGADPASSA